FKGWNASPPSVHQINRVFLLHLLLQKAMYKLCQGRWDDLEKSSCPPSVHLLPLHHQHLHPPPHHHHQQREHRHHLHLLPSPQPYKGTSRANLFPCQPPSKPSQMFNSKIIVKIIPSQRPKNVLRL